MPFGMGPTTNQSRYALYLAPPPESELWRFGCDVIGRDALTGARCDGFAPEGFTPGAWREMTSDPRRYGFHATLKAPFRLRLDLDHADLIDSVAEFAQSFEPFDAGELSAGALAIGDGRAFVALRPEGDLKRLRAFEESVVRDLDRLRAFRHGERRNSARLTPRRAYYLDAWGYPYVLDEFRPHFTLTNAIAEAESVVRRLQRELEFWVPSPALRVDALVLFKESEPGGEFRILRRFPLGHSKRARRRSARAVAPAISE
jgi:2'-5' RNA ligase